MAKSKSRKSDEDDAQPSRDPKSHRRGPQTPRMSITLPDKIHRKVRLAAALADMTENEWARHVLVTASARVVKKHFPHLT